MTDPNAKGNRIVTRPTRGRYPQLETSSNPPLPASRVRGPRTGTTQFAPLNLSRLAPGQNLVERETV